MCACPKVVFGCDIFSPLREGWQERDYIFVGLQGPRGCNVDDATGFAHTMASAVVILRHFRRVMHILGADQAVAELIRRHSFRHWIANITRVADFSPAKKSQAGRWADLGCMPTRYAQEVEFVTMVDIIMEAVECVDRAVERLPIHAWPWLGGWEQLSPRVELRDSPAACVPLECPPEAEDVVDDDERSDVDEDEDLVGMDTNDANGIPPGWKEQSLASGLGSDLSFYVHDDGRSVRSRCAAWQSQKRGMRAAGRVDIGLVGELVKQWDALITAGVNAREVVHGWRIEYVLRGCSASAVGDAYATSPDGVRLRSRKALCALVDDSVEFPAVRPTVVFQTVSQSVCGTPGCTVVCKKDHRHSGEHVFPPLPSRRSGV